jgi:diacylglycerol kinase (ATP)
MIYACTGLWQSFRKEKHMQIHLVSAMLVVLAGLYFGISRWEWVAVSGCITLVMVTEIINSALEKICDLITLERNPTIKYIKDISAAAVLLSCIFAVVTGFLVFGKYIGW